MFNRPFNTVLIRLGVIVAVLAALMLFAPVASSAGECNDDLECTYPENGTDPVVRFSATDQDGDAIEWSLGGADAGGLHDRRGRSRLQGSRRTTRTRSRSRRVRLTTGTCTT